MPPSTAALRLLVMLLPCLLAAPAARAQEGRIVFDHTEHVFGRIDEGPVARHVFTFRNTGDGPLRLRRVATSCGCTTPEWTQAPVSPGETGAVTVVYATGGRPGPFGRSVHVTTDGTPKDVVLRIRGEVVGRPLEGAVALGNLLVDRDLIDFGTVPAGAGATRTVTVQHRGDRPLRFTGTVGVPAAVHVEIPSRPLFTGDRAEVRVTVTAGALSVDAPFTLALVLETDDPLRPHKTLRLVGRTAPTESP